MCETDCLALVLANMGSALTAAYWVCLILGGGLLLISVLGGVGHSDMDVDAHAGLDFHHGDLDAAGAPADTDVHMETLHPEAGHAHDGGASTALSTWVSVRFLVFFLAIFGAVGVILTYMTSTGMASTLAVSAAAGLVLGQAVHHLFRIIRNTSGSGTTQPQDYVNKLARVTIPIIPPDMGEVALQVRGGERFVPAVAHEKFETGAEVVVVTYRAGVAQVVSRREFDGQARPA